MEEKNSEKNISKEKLAYLGYRIAGIAFVVAALVETFRRGVGITPISQLLLGAAMLFISIMYQKKYIAGKEVIPGKQEQSGACGEELPKEEQ